MSTQSTTNNNATNAKEQDMNTQNTTNTANATSNADGIQYLSDVELRVFDILEEQETSLGNYVPVGERDLNEHWGVNDADCALIDFAKDMSAAVFNKSLPDGSFNDMYDIKDAACLAGSIQLTGAAMVAREIRQGFALVAATLAEVSDARQFTSAPSAADIAKHPSAHYGHALNATAANEG